LHFLFGWYVLTKNNLLIQYRKYSELADLRGKRKFYRDQIKETQRAFSELTTNPATQEKFAREHYWMKRDNEDVFCDSAKARRKEQLKKGINFPAYPL